jgi:hypothetical protein
MVPHICPVVADVGAMLHAEFSPRGDLLWLEFTRYFRSLDEAVPAEMGIQLLWFRSRPTDARAKLHLNLLAAG